MVSAPYYGEPCQVFTLGIILYSMLTGQHLYENDNDILGKQLPTHQNISPVARDLILRCLNKDPEKRLTMEDIARHPWMLMDCKDIEKTNM